MVLNAEAFRNNPVAFLKQWSEEQTALSQKIEQARALLPKVEIPEQLLAKAVELCLILKIDGHRGEIVLSRAAKALAAFKGRKKVIAADIKEVATMCLRHRLRKDPLETIDSGAKIKEAMQQLFV